MNDVLKSKKDNAIIPRLEKRESWIEILLALGAASSKSIDYYNLKKRYEVLRVGEADRLIRKRKGDDWDFKFIIAFEEVHSAIEVAHSAVGHGGEKKTHAEAAKKYANLTMECCKFFIVFCIQCQEKKKRTIPKGLVVKPVKSENIFSRCQIDLINMQTVLTKKVLCPNF